MHFQRVIILSLAFLGIVSTFLPWVTLSSILGSYSIDGTSGNGWFSLILFSVCIVLTLLSDIRTPIQGAFFYGVLISSTLAGLIGLMELLNGSGKLDGFVGNLIQSSIEIGWGMYLLLFCGFGIPLVLFLTRSK